MTTDADLADSFGPHRHHTHGEPQDQSLLPGPHPPPYRVGMMWNSGYQMSWGWVVFGLLVVAGLVAIVIAVAARRNPGTSPPRPDGDTPGGTARTILDERLARGEIDSDEYRQRRTTLDEGR